MQKRPTKKKRPTKQTYKDTEETHKKDLQKIEATKDTEKTHLKDQKDLQKKPTDQNPRKETYNL